MTTEAVYARERGPTHAVAAEHETSNEAKFRALLEAAPDAIIGVGPEGRIALVNRQAEVLFGYDRDELIGQEVEMLVPEAVRAVHPCHRQGYFDHPVTRPMGAGMELAGRRKDGSEFPAEISLSAIETEDGLLVSAAVRDVTARERAEAKFRGLLEAAPDAIIGVGSDGRIALVNGQAEALFGYGRSELIGEPVEMLVPEAVRHVHPRHRQGYFDHPVTRPMGAGMELAGRRKDGSEFPAEISLSAIETEEGLLVSAAVRDVTERIEAQSDRERLKAQAERERLEAQLHQSQRLESLGQLAGGVAHDFNNLLAVILNYTSFINEEVTNAASAESGERWEPVRRDVGEVLRAAERATELTHQLLAFGRREVVRPQTLDLNEVVAGVEQMLRRSIGEHVSLVINPGAGLWSVEADPGQLEQVLVNLAVNARDAMPTGGTLTITTTNQVVDADFASAHAVATPGNYVCLELSDTGAGMPREVLRRAFEPFFTTKPKGEGSGLGLATVYGILTQTGGYVQLYSEPGLGTTVKALLPTTESEPAAIEAPARRSHRHGAETILVVEDEDAMREVTRRILTRNGYTVLVAAGGEEALSTVRHHDGEVHLLLTDVVMPHVLGKEVAMHIAALRPEIRVLFMSGYAHPVLASRGTLDDGVALIEKPFSEQALISKVRGVLDIGE